jgi:hypothetical protein
VQRRVPEGGSKIARKKGGTCSERGGQDRRNRGGDGQPSNRAVAKAYGEVEASITHPAPRVNQARRLWGATALRPCRFGFAWKPSPSAPWARGLLSVFWEPGYPDLPACGTWRGTFSGQGWPIFTNHLQVPREGPSLARPRASRPRRIHFIDNSRVPREGPSLARRVASRPPKEQLSRAGS